MHVEILYLFVLVDGVLLAKKIVFFIFPYVPDEMESPPASSAQNSDNIFNFEGVRI